MQAQARYSLGAMGRSLPADDVRVSKPLYTIAEASLFLGQRPSTLRDWVRGGARGSRPIVTSLAGSRGEPIIPFIGLAEGAVASAFRRVPGVKTQYIRQALEKLEDQMGVQHAFASKNLYAHGAQLLFDYVQDDGTSRLIEVVSQNVVFRSVVREALRRIEYANGWAARLILPTTREPIVVADPVRASGQPLTLEGGARIVDLIARFRGGEDPSFIARDYAVPEKDVLEILRVFYSPSPISEAA